MFVETNKVVRKLHISAERELLDYDAFVKSIAELGESLNTSGYEKTIAYLPGIDWSPKQAFFAKALSGVESPGKLLVGVAITAIITGFRQVP